VLDSSPGGHSPRGSIYKGCPNGPLTALFTLSAQSQRYYSHFTPLTTLYRAYYKVTRVFSGRGLCLTMSFGPSATDRHLTLITALVPGRGLRLMTSFGPSTPDSNPTLNTTLIPSRGLRLMTSFGPLAPDRHPTPIMVLVTSLRRCCRS
jgi:hypothetical protein